MKNKFNNYYERTFYLNVTCTSKCYITVKAHEMAICKRHSEKLPLLMDNRRGDLHIHEVIHYLMKYCCLIG